MTELPANCRAIAGERTPHTQLGNAKAIAAGNTASHVAGAGGNAGGRCASRTDYPSPPAWGDKLITLTRKRHDVRGRGDAKARS